MFLILTKKRVEKLKQDYRCGGLGDVKIKKYLISVLESIIAPIRTRRREFAKDPIFVENILREGTERARVVAKKTMAEVKKAVKINYF
jgi:tryptophanyl-tRNA synthetase